MLGVVGGTGGAAPQQVDPGAALAAEEAPSGDRPAWTSAPVGRLVEPVDADRVVSRRALEPVAQVRGLLGVGVTPRIDDQRAPAGGDLDAEQVVVTMAAVAERAAVEDQVALIRIAGRALAPAAALA